MTFDDLSLKKADNALQELYTRLGAGEVDASVIDAAALLVDHILSHFQESFYRPHVERIGRVLIAFLDAGLIDSLAYESLAALSRVLRKTGEILPEPAPNIIDKHIELAHVSLARRCLTAGDEKEAREQLELAGFYDIPTAIAAMRHEANASSRDPQPGVLTIPVTHQPLNAFQSLLTGRLLEGKLDIELTGEWSLLRKRKAIIAFEGKILESEGSFARQLRAAAAVAEDIFINENGQRELSRLPRQYLYSFAGSEADGARAYTGGSAGLGYALLTLDRLDALGFRRRQRRLKGTIAVTGYLGPEGSVLPVDNAGIVTKLKSVFFSASTHFVIPQENLPAAAAALEELAKEFPDRHLELIPVSSVLEAYQEERIFETRRVSAGTVALEKIGRRRKYIVTGASLLAAVIVMLLLIPPMFMRDISRFYVENDVLKFENRFGVVFDTFEPGYHIFKCEIKDPGQPPGLIIHREDAPPVYAYNGFEEDIIPGGKKEFVFIALEVDPTARSPVGRIHVHLLSHSMDELMQQIILSDTLRMMEDDSLVVHTKVNLTWNGLHDFDHDGHKELYIAARNYVMSPSMVCCVSFEDRSVQTFAHYGHFIPLRIHDYNGDGRDELILAGVHGDPLDKGVVCVLDPLHMQGTTPTGLDPSFVDFKEDAALLYIMFPRTVMCDLLEGKCSRPHAWSINPEGADNIWFGVMEGETGVMFSFNSSWRCTDVKFIDTYVSRYKAFMKYHDLEPCDEYEEDLRWQIRYWDKRTQEWVASPP